MDDELFFLRENVLYVLDYISSSNYSNCDRFYIGLYKGDDWLSWQWQLRGKNFPYNNPTYRNWKNGNFELKEYISDKRDAF
jgi:hypothetical protein